MTNRTEGWSRLEQVIKWSGMTTNQFAKQIGLARPDNLYHIKSGRIGLSQGVVKRIVESYPEISSGWLLTGEGSMLNSETTGNIPYFEYDVASAVAKNEACECPTQMLKLPFWEGCDCACRSYDVAMTPDVMPGTIVFLKKTDLTAIIPGEIYVVATANFVLLRRVRVESDDQQRKIILEAATEGYDDVCVAEAEVESIFRLVGTLKLK